MKVLYYIFKKEFRQIFRDPAILRLIFIMPVLQLIILPFAADYEVKNIKVGIVDQDQSNISRNIRQKFEFSGYFTLENFGFDVDEANHWIESEQVDLVIVIPSKFEKELVRENKADIQLLINAVNGTKGNLGAAYTQTILRQYNNEVRENYYIGSNILSTPTANIDAINFYNPLSDYQLFMVPGILAVLLTMVGGFLSALNIVKEKELGTMDQLNVSPIKKHHFILGKLIPFWLLGFIILTTGILVSFIVHGIQPMSNIWVLYLYAGLYLFAIVGFGLLISNFAASQQQAMMIAFFFMLIFILMSGLYTTIESMPMWGQWVAAFNPVTYMVDVMRMILLKGAVLNDILPHILKIIGFGVVLNGLAILTFQKRA